MSWTSGLAIFALIWWVTLFLVLPWGNRPIDAEDVAKGQASSAPQKPRIVLKLAINTVIAGVIFFGVYQVIVHDLVSFRTP